MKNNVAVAESPAKLIDVINAKFLSQPENRPHEALKSCFKMDYIRDWKSWLAKCGKKVVGIFGPSAPHWFEFRQRNSCLADSRKYIICTIDTYFFCWGYCGIKQIRNIHLHLQT